MQAVEQLDGALKLRISPERRQWLEALLTHAQARVDCGHRLSVVEIIFRALAWHARAIGFTEPIP